MLLIVYYMIEQGPEWQCIGIKLLYCIADLKVWLTGYTYQAINNWGFDLSRTYLKVIIIYLFKS